MRLDANQLHVESFPTAPGTQPEPDPLQPQNETLWASTGFCCDTRRDCSTLCRAPTNVCEAC